MEDDTTTALLDEDEECGKSQTETKSDSRVAACWKRLTLYSRDHS